jgi:hypothetical protein
MPMNWKTKVVLGFVGLGVLAAIVAPDRPASEPAASAPAPPPPGQEAQASSPNTTGAEPEPPYTGRAKLTVTWRDETGDAGLLLARFQGPGINETHQEERARGTFSWVANETGPVCLTVWLWEEDRDPSDDPPNIPGLAYRLDLTREVTPSLLAYRGGLGNYLVFEVDGRDVPLRENC